MLVRITCFFTCLFLAHFWSASAQSPEDSVAAARKELAPRPISLPKGEQTLAEVFDELKKQTGNLVVDRRRDKTNPSMELTLENTPFWKALDALAVKAGCDVSPYQHDGKLALIDGVHKSSQVDYANIFRIAGKRVTLSRDLEDGSHTCSIGLEIAWEPRFEPFYVSIGPMEVTYATEGQAPRVEKVPSRGQVHAAGRVAIEEDVRLPAPPRKTLAIASVRGVVKAVGPCKMLDFSFGKLTPIKKSEERRTQTKEKVKVTLTGLKATAERWTIDVLIENPPGGPAFESYQTWLDNNRISLARGQLTWIPEADAEEQLEALTATRAHVRYYFTVKDRKTDLTGWTLNYRTPGQIVELSAPFALGEMPLP